MEDAQVTVADSVANRPPVRFLVFSIFLVAACSLTYELLLATAASYLLGDTVFQFSITIGVYLSSMGVGSWISQFIKKDIIKSLAAYEILLGLTGGVSVFLLYLAYIYMNDWFSIVFYMIVIATGILSGIEIPLFVRLLKVKYTLEENIANTLAFDYLGALAASILFPLILYPVLGLERTACVVGILNAAIGIILLLLSFDLKKAVKLSVPGLAIILLLLVLGMFTRSIDNFFMEKIFRGAVLFSEKTPYQSLSVIKKGDDIRLYINYNLQFCSLDEHRYHETLIHPAFSLLKSRQNVLVLGGGDGLPGREILKYSDVESVTVVDIDKIMTDFATNNPVLKKINKASFSDPKVKVINSDAFSYVRDYSGKKLFDAVVVDLPDPGSITLARLFSLEFYWKLKKIIKDDAIVVLQATSPTFAPHSFWCIKKTLEKAGYKTLPLNVFVPSFGDWGFIVCSKSRVLRDSDFSIDKSIEARFLDERTLASVSYFPKDSFIPEVEVNSLYNLKLVNYYSNDWDKYVSSLILD